MDTLRPPMPTGPPSRLVGGGGAPGSLTTLMPNTYRRRTRLLRPLSLVLTVLRPGGFRTVPVLVSMTIFMLLATQVVIGAQTAAQNPKQAQASRVADGAISVDGRLNEPAWQTAQPVTDFVQSEPVEGAAPTDRMEIRFVYTDSALYIGAHMYSSGAVQAPLSRRDDGQQTESVQIELDTYFDRRTAYMFGVTAAGVRLDHYHPTDNEDGADDKYDPVWQARTAVTPDGWTAELWLPFSQLRFNEQSSRVWGLNIKRNIPSLNEEIYWALIRRTETGWASRFGELRGMLDVEPRSRLELLPYVAGSTRRTGDRDLNDPFDDGKNLSGRVGADIKYGLGSNLTLDITVNPDFGQIEADPAEVNLTVFETIFPERRPFFLEGNNVLVAGTSNFYYSRRIGARPTGPASGDYVDYPDTTTILGAAKVTGRLASGTSIGLLGAVTDEESASISTDGTQSRVQVAPRTLWGVARVIQEIGTQGSTVGAHLTSVHRQMAPEDLLASQLARNAITAGVDARLRLADRTYEATMSTGITYLDGEPAAIEGVQRRNSHLLQRVDQPRIRLDPTRTSFSGAQTRGSFAKVAGRHWLWSVSMMVETPEFEPTDFGRLNFAGDVMGGNRITYRETVPGRFLRAYSISANLNTYSYFDRELGTRFTLGNSYNATFLNFWSSSLNLTRYFRGQDVQLTRGGPAMGTPLGWNTTWSLQNRAGSTTRWRGDARYGSNDLGDHTWSVSGSLSARPSPSLQFSAEPSYSNEHGTRATQGGPINRQYLTSMPGGRPETFHTRYIFGFPNRTTLSMQLRASYIFKPDLTLDVYAEPFAASGRYDGYGETRAPRSKELRRYGTDGTTIERLPDGSYIVTDGDATFTLRNRDFNVRSYRSNVVLRWEWRPGSTLFVVWQQDRASRVSEGQHVGIGDLFGSLSAPGDNIFAIKTTWWFSR